MTPDNAFSAVARPVIVTLDKKSRAFGRRSLRRRRSGTEAFVSPTETACIQITGVSFSVFGGIPRIPSRSKKFTRRFLENKTQGTHKGNSKTTQINRRML
jgi:hypothetical protein